MEFNTGLSKDFVSEGYNRHIEELARSLVLKLTEWGVRHIKLYGCSIGITDPPHAHDLLDEYLESRDAAGFGGTQNQFNHALYAAGLELGLVCNPERYADWLGRIAIVTNNDNICFLG